VVIITPYLIRAPKEADRFSEEKVRQVDRAMEAIHEHHIELGLPH
jgi:hypothetical protein